jgi:hypothetical protein
VNLITNNKEIIHKVVVFLQEIDDTNLRSWRLTFGYFPKEKKLGTEIENIHDKEVLLTPSTSQTSGHIELNESKTRQSNI